MRTKGFYHENGFFNFGFVWDRGKAASYVIGGRSIGKTYDSLKYCRDNNLLVTYVRTGADELMIAGNNATCPYKRLSVDGGFEFRVYGNSQIREVWEGFTDDDGNFTQTRLLAYIVCLVNFAKGRGADFSNVDVIIYDEFIPQTNVRNQIKDPVGTFNNLYDTINRLRGTKYDTRPPVRVFYLSNANTRSSPFLMEGNIDRLITTMEKRDMDLLETTYVGIYMPQDSPVTEARKEVPFFAYKAKTDSRYYEMAFSNHFSDKDDLIRIVDELKLTKLWRVGVLTVWKYNSDASGAKFHLTMSEPVTKTVEGKQYTETKGGLAKCVARYGKAMSDLYKDGCVTYDKGETCLKFMEYFGITNVKRL